MRETATNNDFFAKYAGKSEVSSCNLVSGFLNESSWYDFNDHIHSGGGIGGLTLAAVLHKYYKDDIQVDLYEAKEKFSEIGAGISLWRGPWSIMQLLGLDKALEGVIAGPPEETPRTSLQMCTGARMSFSFTRVYPTGVRFSFRRGDQIEESYTFHEAIMTRKSPTSFTLED